MATTLLTLVLLLGALAEAQYHVIISTYPNTVGAC
jgi:hypothetical protein